MANEKNNIHVPFPYPPKRGPISSLPPQPPSRSPVMSNEEWFAKRIAKPAVIVSLVISSASACCALTALGATFAIYLK